MNKTVSITLKGHHFTLTREELRHHILTCCDTGIAHFHVPPDSVKSFVDRTHTFRGDGDFSRQPGASALDGGQSEPVDY